METGELYKHKNGNTYQIDKDCLIQINNVWEYGISYHNIESPDLLFVRTIEDFKKSFKKVSNVLGNR